MFVSPLLLSMFDSESILMSAEPLMKKKTTETTETTPISQTSLHHKRENSHTNHEKRTQHHQNCQHRQHRTKTGKRKKIFEQHQKNIICSLTRQSSEPWTSTSQQERPNSHIMIVSHFFQILVCECDDLGLEIRWRTWSIRWSIFVLGRFEESFTMSWNANPQAWIGYKGRVPWYLAFSITRQALVVGGNFKIKGNEILFHSFVCRIFKKCEIRFLRKFNSYLRKSNIDILNELLSNCRQKVCRLLAPIT